MMVMIGNNSSSHMHYWAGRYPGKIGWLQGPKWWKKPKPWIPFACDNDAFSAWTQKQPWNEIAYFKMLDRLASPCEFKPLWVLIPDVVADKKATLKNWARYADRVSKYGWPLAFACQDGMVPADIPSDADVAFIGGTTEWKWRNVDRFCGEHKHVHVGRVGTMDRIWLCHDYGAKSCDTTGMVRDGCDSYRLTQLEDFFERKRIPALALNYV